MADLVRSGGLDRLKQQALYVELADDHQVLTPARISQGRAFQMLEHVIAAFEATGDLAFRGFDSYDSTTRSEQLAAEQLFIVRSAFARCAAP